MKGLFNDVGWCQFPMSYKGHFTDVASTSCPNVIELFKSAPEIIVAGMTA